MAKEKEDRKNQQPPQREPARPISWIITVLMFAIFWMWFVGSPSPMPEITWQQFKDEMLVSGDVAKIQVINNERVEVFIKEDRLSKEIYQDFRGSDGQGGLGAHCYFNIGSVEVFHAQLSEAQREIEGPDVPVTYARRQNWWGPILSWLLPIGLLIVFWMFLLRRVPFGGGGGGSSIYSFGKSRARVMEPGGKSAVTFKDVAGLEEAKAEIYELVMFLKEPEHYTKLGAKIPKGVLLAGPPGTGKTLLAKAVAGEAGVPFFSLSGSEFIEMFVGVGAARVRNLFEKAKARAPSIIFIDEIDTIGRARGSAHAFQANDERESTLNQLLAELDGFDPSTGVIVLAATNRGDILDSALLRPGRFDRHIYLELPNLVERQAIFAVHMRPLKLGDDIDKEMLAAQTPGFSGADIANICNEAALIAARRRKETVMRQDFNDAIDRVVGGLEKKSKIIPLEERRRVAYHEAGHVVTSWFLEHAHPIIKVTIIPRGKSLGAAWFLPEEHQIMTKSQMLDLMCTALGGRAAEELVYDEVSSNALDDLEKVTKQAYNMVAYYGLGEALRNISFFDSTGAQSQSLHRPYSEGTAEKIDEEVQRLVDEAYGKATAILTSHRADLETLADELLAKEVVYKEELEQMLGPRPFAAEQDMALDVQKRADP